LLEFNYTIEYKKGKENKDADALSRRDSSLMAITVIQPTWIEAVLASYQQDTHCNELLQRLAIAPDHDNHYTLHARILKYNNRVYIGNDPDLKIQLLAPFMLLL
jgi:hypothetical protein